jgi:hypothetical protein
MRNVEGYCCRAEYCPRCGTAREGPLRPDGISTTPLPEGQQLHDLEYRLGVSEPVHVVHGTETPCADSNAPCRTGN